MIQLLCADLTFEITATWFCVMGGVEVGRALEQTKNDFWERSCTTED